MTAQRSGFAPKIDGLCQDCVWVRPSFDFPSAPGRDRVTSLNLERHLLRRSREVAETLPANRAEKSLAHQRVSSRREASQRAQRQQSRTKLFDHGCNRNQTYLQCRYCWQGVRHGIDNPQMG
jgi:hypothetical protein